MVVKDLGELAYMACHEIFDPGKYFVQGGRKICNFLSGTAINCPLLFIGEGRSATPD